MTKNIYLTSAAMLALLMAACSPQQNASAEDTAEKLMNEVIPTAQADTADSETGMVKTAMAEDSNAPADITRLLKSRLGNVEVAQAVETPATGIYQTRFGANFAYLTGNGRYVFVGDMIDLQSQVNLTELSRRTINKELIDSFDPTSLAIFPAHNETRSVLTVFTDTSCPYCKKLHEEVPQLQQAGIEVRYIPFPRGGARGPGYQTLKQVWCGEDKAKSLSIAKGVETGELASADCEQASVVDAGYVMGNKLGVTGTPALFTDKGEKIEGYVPHQKLIPMLLN